MLASSEEKDARDSLERRSFSYRKLLLQAIKVSPFNFSPLPSQTRLKLLELLDGGTGPRQHTEGVETDLF